MAEKDIIQNLIFQLGQSQDERLPEELKGHFADIDEQTTAQLLQLLKTLAEFVNYYEDNPATTVDDWSNFFPDLTTIQQRLDNKSGNTPPHLALLLTFLELYKQPQNIINNITARHLDFYYHDVLQLKKKGAIADKVHLLLELKKNTAPIPVLPKHLFSAGKDKTKVELIYVPTGETIINAAQVESLRSLFFDQEGKGTIRYAPIANSSDGLGGKLLKNEPKWFGFGHSALPAAKIGFAIASPVLRMKEGNRKVTVSLTLDINNFEKTQLNDTLLKDAFEIFITGEKRWLGPCQYLKFPQLKSVDRLEFTFKVPGTEKAIIDYNATIHGYDYNAQAPIIQVLLRDNNSDIGYKNFSGITLKTAKVSVEVSNITSLHLENDLGTLDPKKAFLPFGPQPTKGSRFLVGCAEALNKKLSEIDLTVQWKDAPSKFADHYRKYGEKKDDQVVIDRDGQKITVNNSYFTATVSFKDGGSWTYESKKPEQLFNASDATSQTALKFSINPSSPSASSGVTEGMIVYFLGTVGSKWGMELANQYLLRKPLLASIKAITPDSFIVPETTTGTSLPEILTGFITFSLNQDFLHDTYRQKYVENVLKYSKQPTRENPPSPDILNEPYTPKIQSISLAYKAHSDKVNISSTSLDDFANPDLQFFHLTYFGPMREHGYQRKQIKAKIEAEINTAVPLLPRYNHAGELLIGLSQLKAGDSVSILFQVVEGSANPDLPSEDLHWFVLCDNYWKPLSRSEVVLDTTNQLLTSGIIRFVIPLEATTHNTILPKDLIWLKAGIQRKPTVKDNVTAVCQLIDVVANAIEVQFVDQGNDPNHLLTALQPGRITKLKNGLSAIKTVKQPYASFGGRAVETHSDFYTRVSERLRHKNRCLTAWDYERIILEAFPKVHQVKCIPHANEHSWLAPGHILIIVVPDLKNKNAINLLEPKVDTDTIERITDYVKKRAGMQVKVKVKNPRYQTIQLEFKVKFYAGYEFNYYHTQLKQEIINFLSPWAYNSQGKISFGGKVYKSVLLDFVEDLSYVDYVTDFKMSSLSGNDVNEVQPDTPDTILVSHSEHTIRQVT